MVQSEIDTLKIRSIIKLLQFYALNLLVQRLLNFIQNHSITSTNLFLMAWIAISKMVYQRNNWLSKNWSRVLPGVPIKMHRLYNVSYLQQYWIWRLQISYSNLAWVKLVHWKIPCDPLNLFKLCRYLKISKFSAL